MTMRRAQEALHEFSDLRTPSMIYTDNPIAEDVSFHWRAPDHGGFEINCDVAVKRNGKDAKCNVVLRERRGLIVDGRVVSAEIASTFHGELLAYKLYAHFKINWQ
ncbi:hypothetical protein RHMOL_Rhmol03G0011800 [Rhododendron molle]|uniref:Uncharacterized protein n=1 Tax=Rhododendron molle TaxID=49168 RepID=A0ACC0PAE6_RHOML|nr:hypothetical protein RHMOL_Rhmol03G0011800 [Rhododendron molle]